MEGRTTASFRCPCSDVAAPARHSFWVELVGLAGFPAVLHGRCFRCGDKRQGDSADRHKWRCPLCDRHKTLINFACEVAKGARN